MLLCAQNSWDGVAGIRFPKTGDNFAIIHLFEPRNPLMARMVNCIKLGKEAEGLDFPPYPGELGKRIWENVSKEAWAGWLKHQTMLVNENRLNLADARARQYLARQMENHFFGSGADQAAGYVPPSA
jgi:Fe-S cluster biosynthesis and repair protein YggX